MNIHLFSPKDEKGIILGLVALLLFCTGNASAQDFIGGSFSFDVNANTFFASETLGRTSHSTINVAPDLGWFVGDKWAVGIRPAVGFGLNTDPENDRIRTFSLEIVPYARYRLLAYNRFGFWAEADPRLYYSQSKGETTDVRTTIYGASLLPVLTYQLNSHISMESRLNLLSLSLSGWHIDNNGHETDVFIYGLGASTNDVMDTLGAISIGFLYKF